jgi:thiol-disulfide isomerase/thioredoxin
MKKIVSLNNFSRISPSRRGGLGVRLILILLLLPFLTDAQINFETGNWQQVLAKSRASGKPIFVDFYADWCKPCKMLDKKTYLDPQVIAKMNSTFINYKVNAEEGEGPKLARKFEVEGFPYLLFVSKDERRIFNDMGYMAAKDFLEMTDKALNIYKEGVIEDFDMQYKNGDKNPTFLESYIGKRKRMMLDNRDLVEEYLDVLKPEERTSEKALQVVANNNFTLNGKAIDILMNQQGIFKKYGISTEYIVSGTMLEYFRNALKKKDLNFLERLFFFNEKLNLLDGKKQNEQYRMEFYKNTNNQIKYIETATNLADKYLMTLTNDELKRRNSLHFEEFMRPFRMGKQDSLKIGEQRFKSMKLFRSRYVSINTASDLEGLAMEFFKNMTDKSQLEKALRWAKRATEIDENPDNLDSYAHVLLKLDRKSEAIIYEEKALNLAKAQKVLTMRYEDELAKMKR